MIDSHNVELLYSIDGESYAMPLSVTQFEIISKILGLQFMPDGTVQCFTDKALDRFTAIKNNPLQLVLYDNT